MMNYEEQLCQFNVVRYELLRNLFLLHDMDRKREALALDIQMYFFYFLGKAILIVRSLNGIEGELNNEKDINEVRQRVQNNKMRKKRRTS